MPNLLAEVFRCLEAHEARYLVIGGVAVGLHGIPRTTFDLDILIETSEMNAQRVLDALLEAGIGAASLTSARDVLTQEITILRDRLQIDIQTATPGIQFQRAWESRATKDYEGIGIPVVSREDLISSKRAAGRPRDLEDARLLEGLA